MFLVCASDIENQRKGILVLFWGNDITPGKFRLSNTNKVAYRALAVRIVSIHFTGRDTLTGIVNVAKSLLIAR